MSDESAMYAAYFLIKKKNNKLIRFWVCSDISSQ